MLSPYLNISEVIGSQGMKFQSERFLDKSRSFPRNHDFMMAHSIEIPDKKIILSAPKYMSAPLLSRRELGRKLTQDNRKYSDLGLLLQKKYCKFKLLTPEEERIASRFSVMGRKLNALRSCLEKSYGREPSLAEWSRACNITEKALQMYLKVSLSARNSLVQHNMRLVDYWVRKMIQNTKAAKKISYYELMTFGVLGLSKAVERYDGRSRFCHFADIYIRSELYRGITLLRPGNFISSNKIKFNIEAQNVQWKLQQELNRKPTDEEIAERLGVGINILQKTRLEANMKLDSIDTIVGEDRTARNENGPKQTFQDLYLCAEQNNQLFTSEALSDKVDLLTMLSGLLPAHDRRTLVIRYGLLDGKPKSISTTAQLMCMSEESVRLSIIRSIQILKMSPTLQLLNDGAATTDLSPSAKVGGRMY